MKKSRFLVGIALVAVAALVVVLPEGGSASGAAALGSLGLILIATSRREKAGGDPNGRGLPEGVSGGDSGSSFGGLA